MDHFDKRGIALLRIGLALVFLWFGISQLVSADTFIGYVPQWLISHGIDVVHEHPFQFAHNFDVPVHRFIMLNGALEVILGLMLIMGLFTRVTALILSMHLMIITLSLGYNDIAVRDFGLAIATLSIFFLGTDRWTLDESHERSIIKQVKREHRRIRTEKK